MFGRPEYSTINAAFNDAFTKHSPLVSVHRGTGIASIAENTVGAIIAAVKQGADIVEIDIIESTDGDYFLFHDGYEPMSLGVNKNIRTMSTAEIEQLNYRWASNHRYPVERFSTVLETFTDTLFNVDRSWWWWPGLLDFMADYNAAPYCLLKSPFQDDALAALENHAVKFPYIPIVKTTEQVDALLANPKINTVGFELIADSNDHPFAQADYIANLHDQGMAAYLNAIVLSDRKPLFAGYDDEVSIFDDPQHGWGELVNLGADVIQTDWPGLLSEFLRNIGRR